eukprot:276189_1
MEGRSHIHIQLGIYGRTMITHAKSAFHGNSRKYWKSITAGFYDLQRTFALSRFYFYSHENIPCQNNYTSRANCKLIYHVTCYQKTLYIPAIMEAASKAVILSL